MIRSGSGEHVVLLHGVTGSATMWRTVVPLLEPHYEIIALTALGHRGGRPGLRAPPSRIWSMTPNEASTSSAWTDPT